MAAIPSIRPTIEAVRDDAGAAGDAAWAAARAAAWDAARAAAWDAARAAAWDAARAAAWDAARAAAWDAARAAAWDAARAAVWAAAAAGAKLAPVKTELQRSAVALIERMCALSDAEDRPMTERDVTRIELPGGWYFEIDEGKAWLYAPSGRYKSGSWLVDQARAFAAALTPSAPPSMEAVERAVEEALPKGPQSWLGRTSREQTKADLLALIRALPGTGVSTPFWKDGKRTSDNKCCSAVEPCFYQQVYPDGLCNACTKTAALRSATPTRGQAGGGENTFPTRLRYRNHAGETAVRTLGFTGKMVFEKNEWHPIETWLLEAFDLDRPEQKEPRLFAFSGFLLAAMENARPTPAPAPGVPAVFRCTPVGKGLVRYFTQAELDEGSAGPDPENWLKIEPLYAQPVAPAPGVPG